ncbi:MAG TPA: aminotransferase class V-fold PLP-dependent enzyme [Myxococcales bacterium]
MTAPLSKQAFDFRGEALWALHCAEGPVPRASVDAARAFLEKELRPWELGAEDWTKPADDVRREAGLLFGAEVPDFTLTSSTSGGLTCVAQSYPWKSGDEVLAPLGEFPSNVWPWKALAPRGVSFREVPLWDGHLAGARALDSKPPSSGDGPSGQGTTIDPEARLLAAIGPKTRILTVSWVRFQDGLRLDLARLARGCAERGVDFVVDGIQGAGALPIRLRGSGIAAFATAVHKGLLSPQGAGLLWTEPGFRSRLAPMGSWLSVEGGLDFGRPSTDYERPWLSDGRKFEQGGSGGLLLVPLAVSLRLLREAGSEAIARHVDATQARLLSKITGGFQRDAQRLDGLRREGRLGPILGFHHGGAGAQLVADRAKEGGRRKIFVSVREGYLRVALHGWHDEGDVERLAAWLSA